MAMHSSGWSSQNLARDRGARLTQMSSIGFPSQHPKKRGPCKYRVPKGCTTKVSWTHVARATRGVQREDNQNIGFENRVKEVIFIEKMQAILQGLGLFQISIFVQTSERIGKKRAQPISIYRNLVGFIQSSRQTQVSPPLADSKIFSRW